MPCGDLLFLPGFPHFLPEFFEQGFNFKIHLYHLSFVNCG